MRKKSKPKQLKFSKDYSDNDVLVMQTIFELLKDPTKIRDAVREQLTKRRRYTLDEFR